MLMRHSVLVLIGASLKDIQSFFVKHSAMSNISFKMWSLGLCR